MKGVNCVKSSFDTDLTHIFGPCEKVQYGECVSLLGSSSMMPMTASLGDPLWRLGYPEGISKDALNSSVPSLPGPSSTMGILALEETDDPAVKVTTTWLFP